MNEVIVSMNNISKSFPGVKALDHVKFELRSGEVMAGRKWSRKIDPDENPQRCIYQRRRNDGNLRKIL